MSETAATPNDDNPSSSAPERLPEPDDPSRALHEKVRAAPASAWRLEPEERKRRYLTRHGVGLPAQAPPEEVDDALERVIGARDFLPGNWLSLGARRADAVGMVRLPGQTATGFLVSPWLLLTNAHVLRDPDSARGQEVVFRYVLDERERAGRARTVGLDPDACFVTGSVDDDGLDFTVVALEPFPNGKPAGATLGVIPLRGLTGKAVLGDHLNIIQHPGFNTPLHVALRSNLLVELDDERHLTYETDTDSGSSGSPVLNDDWDLVALHSRAVSARDEHGQDIDRDGQLVTRDTPASRRVWVANRGERVSAIVAELRARALDAAGSRAGDLITEALTLGGNT
ncbi:trypsin-like serine peptidase [Cellulomonas fengjieae]|uniref:trypsin-like serine peptidase n=1 Tax=Cellulomonas fengjieae TaxID=2819978 RepID=UPI001AAEE8DD|nr:serine protease [Cellulomonas fengjieae]MBO3102773.1 trypsin-like peptidase domain-containing protein [Cellulomonas fengjieae]